jgi:hypothetical protein
MPPLDETDVLAWALGKTWWTGPLLLAAIFIIMGT